MRGLRRNLEFAGFGSFAIAWVFLMAWAVDVYDGRWVQGLSYLVYGILGLVAVCLFFALVIWRTSPTDPAIPPNPERPPYRSPPPAAQAPTRAAPNVPPGALGLPVDTTAPAVPRTEVGSDLFADWWAAQVKVAEAGGAVEKRIAGLYERVSRWMKWSESERARLTLANERTRILALDAADVAEANAKARIAAEDRAKELERELEALHAERQSEREADARNFPVRYASDPAMEDWERAVRKRLGR
jgi:hypothetical protein